MRRDRLQRGMARGGLRGLARAVTRATLAGAILLAAVPPRPAAAHPLHTSLTELTYDPAARMLRVSVRVFVDDFATAVARRTGAAAGRDGVPPDAAIFRYVHERFAVADRGGRPVALRWCGRRLAGDLLFVCLEAPAATPPSGARVRNALLTEMFDDQVNIVQAAVAGRRQTLLFTPKDASKVLR